MSPEQLEQFVNSGAYLSGIPSTSNPEDREVHVHLEVKPQIDKEPPQSSIPVEQATPSVQSQQASQSAALLPTRTEGFDFKDPVELLYFLDDDISSGRVKLHPWQVQFMVDFARDDHTKESPFQAAVQACNGSGKDKYIVAACAVWICMAYLQSRCVITNGSGVQLDNQTEVYIDLLCQRANSKIHPGVWKRNYRYYECLPCASPITLFATDEPNKAEGYHPIVAGAKMAIFTSESKSIPDSIFEALERCSGFTHRVDVSTPGAQLGYFYDVCSTALDRKSIEDIKALKSSQVILYKVTAYDCSHIAESEIERIASKLPGGRNNPVFRSSVLSEFGTTDEMVVIPYTFIWKATNSVPRGGWLREPYNKAGLDLSDGGDETVLQVRNGNKHIAQIPFRFDNTEDTIEFLNDKFREFELTNPEAFIYADCGGLGKPMLDRMRRQGWSNIRYFDNRAAAFEPRTYRNRGAESWFHLRRLLELHELELLGDKDLTKQLASRYYKIMNGAIHQLLSKIEQRSRGYPSPDRADALVLAFCDYKATYKPTTVTEPFRQPPVEVPKSEFTMQEWAKRDTEKYNRNPSRRLDFTELREDIAKYNEVRSKQTTANT